MTSSGRFQLKAARFALDDGPIDETCKSAVCGRYSRAYLRHLLSVGEPTGGRLLTLHNLAWLLALMDDIRDAVLAGSLGSLRGRVGEAWQHQTLR